MEQLENWIATQEVSELSSKIIAYTFTHLQLYLIMLKAFLNTEDEGDSLEVVEGLIKKQESFEKSLAAQEEKFKVKLSEQRATMNIK